VPVAVHQLARRSLPPRAPAVYDLLKRHVHRRDMRELFRAVTVYALIGYGFLAVSFLTLFAKAPGMAKAYINGSQATKDAMEAIGLPELDPNGWIVFGGVATWVIVFAATASAISAPVWGIALGRQLIRAAPPDTTSSGLQGR